MTTLQTPREKFSIEVRALLNRWVEESDLPDLELAEVLAETLNAWLEEEFISFEADDDLLENGQ